jgi:hypothetical protein
LKNREGASGDFDHQEGRGLSFRAPGRSCGSPLFLGAWKSVLDSPATWLENLYLSEGKPGYEDQTSEAPYQGAGRRYCHRHDADDLLV